MAMNTSCIVPKFSSYFRKWFSIETNVHYQQILWVMENMSGGLSIWLVLYHTTCFRKVEILTLLFVSDWSAYSIMFQNKMWRCYVIPSSLGITSVFYLSNRILIFFLLYNSRTCEICGSLARNVAGANEAELMEQWNETNDAAAAAATAPVNPTETQNFWQGHRFLNFLLACMVFAFVISWLFHFNVPSWNPATKKKKKKPFSRVDDWEAASKQASLWLLALAQVPSSVPASPYLGVSVSLSAWCLY